MQNIKIGTRLSLSFAFLLLFMLILAGLGLWRIDASNVTQLKMDQLHKEQHLINQLDNYVSEQSYQPNERAIGIVIEAINDMLKEDAQALTLFEDVVEKYDAHAKDVSLHGSNSYANYQQSMNRLAGYQQDKINELSGTLVNTNSTVRIVLIALAIAAFVVGVLQSVLITRSITRPLNNAVKIAQEVAAKDLSKNISIRGSDETAMLLKALQQMTDNLRTTVGSVRASAQEMSLISHQILTENENLSHRTEEQASSLTETAAAMEELTATVRQNADNAQQANVLALSASEIAVRGGEIVSEVVSTMESITESSKKVEDIIGVIDSIAFQTNILALNAAVESARAGEAGRGFAVVAGEVRSLAQRSAQAAREIKELINVSTQSTLAGSRLTSEAGQTMTEIVDAIQRVTDIMGEISAASQEQSAGIEQVNDAVIQMDQVTRDNASQVEQSTAGAQTLQEQANRLNELVNSFRFSAHDVKTSNKPTQSEPARSTVALPAATAATSGAQAPTTPSPDRQRKDSLIGKFQTSAGTVEEWEDF